MRYQLELLDDLDVVAQHLGGPYPEAVDEIRSTLTSSPTTLKALEALYEALRYLRLPHHVSLLMKEVERAKQEGK